MAQEKYVDIGGLGYGLHKPVVQDLALIHSDRSYLIVDPEVVEGNIYFGGAKNLTYIRPTTENWDESMRARYEISLENGAAAEVRMDFILDSLKGRKLDIVIDEIHRILKPGGTFTVVDFSRLYKALKASTDRHGFRVSQLLKNGQIPRSGYPLSHYTTFFMERKENIQLTNFIKPSPLLRASF
ncbi:MAG: hypothetical protein NTV98_03830 [Candidatus Roizmanbacteria bacterium]|nr:hypothetical protein [Candidatus Roizmanbacteria bacterium]